MIPSWIRYRALGLLFFLGISCIQLQGQDTARTGKKGDDKVWSLQECVKHAHENNLQVRKRKLSVKSSELDRKQSYYDLLPNLNAFGNHGYNWGQRVDQFTNQFVTRRVRSNSFSLSSELVLFQGMQRYNRIQQREEELKAAKAQVQKAKNDIALQIATAYLQILFSKEILDVRKGQRDRSKMQVERMRDLYDAGEVSKGEMLDVVSQWESEKLKVVQARNDLELNRLRLIQLLQLKGPKAQDFSIQDPPSRLSNKDSLEGSAASIFQKAADRMPSIKAAEASIQGAEERLAAAQGGRSPTLSLSGSYGTGYSGMRKERVGQPNVTGYDTVGLTTGGEAVLQPNISQETRTIPFKEQFKDNLNQTVGLQLSVPIFQRMAVNTQIKKARINLQKARLDKESARDQLRQDIQQAYADAIAARRKYRAAQKTVKAREESFSYAKARFEAGAINAVDYANAKTQLAQAHSEMLQAKYEKLFKQKVLGFYLGEPLTMEAKR